MPGDIFCEVLRQERLFKNLQIFSDPRPAKSRNHAISDWGHKDTPGDTFWLAGIYFLGLVTF